MGMKKEGGLRRVVSVGVGVSGIKKRRIRREIIERYLFRATISPVKRFLRNIPSLVVRRKCLRNRSTPAEKLLWKKLQKSGLGCKFRRQYSFGNYILDFYCPEKKLGIELDGKIHDMKKEMDAYRTGTLAEYGIRIIRFSNQEIESNIERVVEKIIMILTPPS
jgi:very-short-patch-repair endonuclease